MNMMKDNFLNGIVSDLNKEIDEEFEKAEIYSEHEEWIKFTFESNGFDHQIKFLGLLIWSSGMDLFQHPKEIEAYIRQQAHLIIHGLLEKLFKTGELINTDSPA